MDERVVGLLDVHLTFAFVRGHRASLHGHLASTELHQVLAGGAAGPGHHAGEEGSRRHNEELVDRQVGPLIPAHLKTEYLTCRTLLSNLLQIFEKHVTITYL